MKRILIVSSFCVLASTTSAQQAQMSDADYIALIRAAPHEVVNNATIMRLDGSNMKSIKQGSNQWTCMTDQNLVPMCGDPGAMEWAHAWTTHATPPDKTGFLYMLSGDKGASNTDPWATGKTADNHWIETGPYVMWGARRTST